MDKERKEFIEEATKSEYFDYLTEKKLNTKISEKIRKAKLIITSVFSIIIAISIFLGINLNKSVNSLKTQFKDFENDMKIEREEFTKEGSKLINSLKYQQSDFQIALDGLEGKRVFYDKYMGLLTTNISNLELRANEIYKNNSELERNLEVSDNQMDSLENLKEILSAEIVESRVLNAQVKSTISSKYMCIERGSLNKKASDYKEYTSKLPDSDSTITAIFYGADFDKEKNKRASIKIIIKNSNGRQTKEQTFTFIEQEDELHIKDTHFYIEPLMFYYPPNTVGLHISAFYRSLIPFRVGYNVIPDFLFMRVYIKE